MTINHTLKTLCCILISLSLSNVAQAAAANDQLISTATLIEKFDRQAAENRTQEFLSRSDVKQMLLDRGVSSEEASQRIASLSDAELQNLSDQIHMSKAGGSILVTILLVVLIIFLIKRI